MEITLMFEEDKYNHLVDVNEDCTLSEIKRQFVGEQFLVGCNGNGGVHNEEHAVCIGFEVWGDY